MAAIKKKAKVKSKAKPKARGRRTKEGFRAGDRIIVINDKLEEVINASVIYKAGKIIGISKRIRGKLCVEFEEEIIGGHSGNSLRFFGAPFKCFWVNPNHVSFYSKEVKQEIEKQKEVKAQRIEDEWYGQESYL